MKPDSDSRLTPMMQQYRQAKAACGDAILLFRLGDFYEMFEEDARIASQVLELTLTRKPVGGGQTVPLAGLPYHALNNYLFKLTQAGYRVAICEQVEDPKTTKQLVKREIVRTVTPGTLIESDAMEARENNYLVAIWDEGLTGLGVAAMDISTAEFKATAFSSLRSGSFADCTELITELARLSPREVIFPDDLPDEDGLLVFLKQRTSATVVRRPRTYFRQPLETPEELFGEVDPETLDKQELTLARTACQALLRYLSDNKMLCDDREYHLLFYQPSRYMAIDPSTGRNLELVRNMRDGSRRGSLLSVLDQTRTPLGARALRQWLLNPLLDANAIRQRQQAVAVLIRNFQQREEFVVQLEEIKDLQRLLTRVLYRSASPRDLKSLGMSLAALPRLNEFLAGFDVSRDGQAQSFFDQLDEIPELAKLLSEAIVEEPPATNREGGVFADGYHSELDELRRINQGGKDWILDLQARERESTGIPSLKIGFNKVFGYYIEITRTHQNKVPDSYIRKQTLVSAERYITPELKDYENKVLGARERSIALERDLYDELLKTIATYAARIEHLAERIAVLDVLASLALVAIKNHYVCPLVDDSEAIVIEQGRHPTLETNVRDLRFVPNDTSLDNQEKQIMIITGPNMGGKSTYIRQVALIVVMAQIGSYVPAQSAQIGVVDAVFSRVGASDNLYEGQSTFMVEMAETAHILRNVSPRSLVILDEIGRGTATYDGISLAWSIVEYLHRVERKGVKTLFATHYHEMADLEQRLKRVHNQHAAVADQDGKIAFLYQIMDGSSDHSYGIHVAELAGLPASVTQRATRILHQLESGAFHSQSEDSGGSLQMTLFNLLDEPIAMQLSKLKVEDMTPIEALHMLDNLVKQAQGR